MSLVSLGSASLDWRHSSCSGAQYPACAYLPPLRSRWASPVTSIPIHARRNAHRRRRVKRCVRKVQLTIAFPPLWAEHAFEPPGCRWGEKPLLANTPSFGLERLTTHGSLSVHGAALAPRLPRLILVLVPDVIARTAYDSSARGGKVACSNAPIACRRIGSEGCPAAKEGGPGRREGASLAQ